MYSNVQYCVYHNCLDMFGQQLSMHFIPIRHKLSSVWTVPARNCGALGAHTLFLNDITWKCRLEIDAMPRCSQRFLTTLGLGSGKFQTLQDPIKTPKPCIMGSTWFNWFQSFPLYNTLHWSLRLRNIIDNTDQYSMFFLQSGGFQIIDALWAWQPALLAAEMSEWPVQNAKSPKSHWAVAELYGSSSNHDLIISDSALWSGRIWIWSICLCFLSFFPGTSQVIFWRAPVQTLPWKNYGCCHVYGCLWNFLIKLDHSMNKSESESCK